MGGIGTPICRRLCKEGFRVVAGCGEFYASFESGGFVKLRTPLCLSHHPPSPLTQEEVLERAQAGR
jgi:hypothetical protein